MGLDRRDVAHMGVLQTLDNLSQVRVCARVCVCVCVFVHIHVCVRDADLCVCNLACISAYV